MARKKTYKEIIEKIPKSLTLLSREYINAHTKMLFKCSCGNIFKTSYNEMEIISK